jgi:peptide/nickel transport system permease protein
MIGYIINRLWQSLILLVLVSMIGYAVLNLAPGGPLSQYSLMPGMTKEALDRIAEQMGLNRPLYIQYANWAWNMIQGDWGTSFRDKRSVLAVIASVLPATLLLMVASTILSVIIGTAIGVYSAVRRGSIFDYVATIFAMIALSIPTFWFGLIAIYAFSVQLAWLPAGNMFTPGDGSIKDIAIHLLMPSVVLALVNVAVWSRYMRSATLEVLGQDFIRTAHAKGVHPRHILVKHVMGNALLPMITLAGMQIPALIGGALVTETVFTWPGMGRLFLDSLGYNDYPVVMGILMFSAILVVLGSLISDIITALIDPRIQLS